MLLALTRVAHAAGQALGLAVRHALALVALAALEAAGAVLHRGRARTLARGAGAARLLLAGRVLGVPALHTRAHERAVLAAGRVLVAADGALAPAQLAVLVAAGVVVLGAEEPRVALLVALDPQITAEGLLGLREAPAGLRLEHVPYGPQTARGEALRYTIRIIIRITIKIRRL
jgi:hypothetical protein